MAATNMSSIPQIRDIESREAHAHRVKLLATAVCCETYATEWPRNEDGFFTPPQGIQTAIDQMYEKLSQDRLIGKYVIPDQVNDKWIGIQTDHIFYSIDRIVDTGTNNAIGWEDAIMAASLFLRQKYLEIIGDMSLWAMNATTTSPGLREPSRVYNTSNLPEKRGVPAEDEDEIGPADRTYFLQNRRDVRMLLPSSVRAIVQGNLDLSKTPSLPDVMVTTPFAGFSGIDKLSVALGGVQ